MKQLLTGLSRSLGFGVNGQRTPENNRRHRPELETLENRLVPTINIYLGTGSSAGYLFIDGSNNSDSVTVYQEDAYNVKVRATEATPWGNVNYYNSFDGAAVNWIIFRGYDGNDFFNNITRENCSAWGGRGTDTFYGGRGLNYFYGEQDTDWLVGNENNDYLDGGSGLDYLWGNEGNDYLDGGRDGVIDWLNGGKGQDTFALHKSLSYSYYGYWGYTTEQENVVDYNPWDGDVFTYVYPSNPWYVAW